MHALSVDGLAGWRNQHCPPPLAEEAQSNERRHWRDKGLGAAITYESMHIYRIFGVVYFQFQAPDWDQGFGFIVCLFVFVYTC